MMYRQAVRAVCSNFNILLENYHCGWESADAILKENEEKHEESDV
jgi:hypothetical protein